MKQSLQVRQMEFKALPELIPQLVSTIIPVYNRPQMLREAVQSVLNQTYRPIEVIIADDASTDETPLVGRELAQQHPGVVRFAGSPENSGSGPGPMRELGRQQARGEFLQYLDSDDRLLPDKFTDQVRTLREHPECDIAYGLTRLVDQDGRIFHALPAFAISSGRRAWGLSAARRGTGYGR